MKLYKVIQSNRALSLALNLVYNAKSDMVFTMNVNEEYKAPLPKKYHLLVEKRIKEGIPVVRYGFGKKKYFLAIKKRHKKVKFVYKGSLLRYQRLLIVDKNKGMFVFGNNIYYTEFRQLAQSLVKYVETVYNKEDI